MINLLPPQEKMELRLQKNKKLIIILGSIFLISLTCLLLLLFSVKFYILEQLSYENSAISSAKKLYQTSDYMPIKDLIKKYNTKLQRMNAFYGSQIYVSDALKAVLDLKRSDGLRMNNIAVSRTGQSEALKVTIAGIADKRDDLLAFKSEMENNALISNVNFPPDDWVKPVDVNFTVTFDIKPTTLK